MVAPFGLRPVQGFGSNTRDQLAAASPGSLSALGEGKVPNSHVMAPVQPKRVNRPSARLTPMGLSYIFLPKEIIMKGGTKPLPGTRRAEKFKDGAKKSGGANTTRHAGPKSASKTAPTGTTGAQLERRLHS